jgi:hypothetical protein
MSRSLLALAAIAILSSCGTAPRTAPRDLENACAIVAERPNYFSAMRRAERRWGVPIPVQMAVIHQESKFIGNARTPHQFALGVIPMGRMSSAYGYAQALDGTWDEHRSETGRRRAKRDDIRDATDFMGWYMDKTARGLGVPKSDAGTQYLAYHEGRSGYSRGSHLGKGWLMEVSRRVDGRALRYAEQLRACRRI